MKRKTKMVIYILILGLILLVLIGVFWSRISVKESRLFPSGSEISFPVVSGSNLMREEFEFPRDFEGKYNLVIIPFQQIQQRRPQGVYFGMERFVPLPGKFNCFECFRDDFLIPFPVKLLRVILDKL